MATEQEELKLVVTLDDQASASLVQLRNQLEQLSRANPITKQTEAFKQAGRAAKEGGVELAGYARSLQGLSSVSAAAATGIRSLAGAFGGGGIAGGGLLGAVAALDVGLAKFSTSMIKLDTMGKSIGVIPGQFKAISESLERMGYSTEEAQSELGNFFNVINEGLRPGSREFQSILENAANPQAVFRSIERWKTEIESGQAGKAVQEAAQAVQQMFQRELARGVGRGEATRQALAFAKDIGLSVKALDITGSVFQGTPQEWATQQRRIDAAREFNREWQRLLQTGQEFLGEVAEPLLPVFQSLNVQARLLIDAFKSGESPFIKGLKTDIEDISKILRVMRGDFSFLDPNSVENRSYIPPGQGEYGKRLQEALEAEAEKRRTQQQQQGRGGARGPGGARDMLGGPRRLQFMGGDAPPALGPYSATTGGLDDFLSGSPESGNIEDRREENTEQLEKLTEQLKELNTNLAYGFLGTQMGGLPPGLGGGTGRGELGAGGGMGGLPGFETGGRGRGGGTPGTDSGGTPGTPSAGTPSAGTPSGTGALWGQSGAGAPLSGLQWPGGDKVVPSAGTANQQAWPPSPFGEAGTNDKLAADRAKFAEELKEPRLRDKFMALAKAEVGDDPAAQRKFLETVANRASARGQTLDQATQTIATPGGQYPYLGDPSKLTDADRKAFTGHADAILGGSDTSNRSTGNASGTVNRSYPTRATSGPAGPGQERYVLERDKRDEGWSQRMQGGKPVTKPIVGAGGSTPGTTQGLDGPQALAIARQHLDEDEIRDQGKLSAWFREQGIKINPAATPWCAAFVNASLGQAGIKGTGSLAASSFYKYGTPVKPNEAQAGDIAVWPHHVAFLTGERKDGQLEVLGGNQPGTVSGRGGVSTNLRQPGFTIRRPPPGAGSQAEGRGGAGVANVLDWSTGRELDKTSSVNVNGSGKLSVDVKAPAGTGVSAEGGGLFKQVEMNRQTTMTKAASGPPEPIAADK